ncbi:MAG: hypothetical protein QOI72_325 [Solirubrobacterales bacterium]|jgi:hypothetical protein|nr:hypothetical protein [Solirubrobacterales bacterium]
MQKTLLRTFAFVAALALVLAASASALHLQVGNIVVDTDGGFTPTTLPKHELAPIEIHGYGKIETSDGSLPPILKQLVFWFDKNGGVETRGLAVCPMRKLVATTPARARKSCSDSIVGTGFGKAVVNFPEQAPIPATSPLTIFNAPPLHGNPAVFVHAYTTIGGPSTFIISVEIQKVHDGRYGFKTVADIPKIVNGYGTPLYGRIKIGKKWTYKGKKLSYVNASCPDGRLQAKVRSSFKDGTVVEGTFVKPCQGK